MITDKDRIAEAVAWYSSIRSTYERLTDKVSNLLEDRLANKNINYYTIQSRTKKIESFKEKIALFNEFDSNRICDLTGIRIIGYVESDSNKICKIIKNSFTIESENFEDHSSFLGVDRVGYQSKHFTARFKKERSVLSEFREFENMYFEIQVRTILQHAWAEISHDRNYKYRGKLPRGIHRRFNLLSGSLELIDYHFEQISNQIERYSKNVSRMTKEGKLKIPINSTSLRQFLTERFGMPGIVPYVSRTVVKELHVMGIKTLLDLDKIIPHSFEFAYSEYSRKWVPDSDNNKDAINLSTPFLYTGPKVRNPLISNTLSGSTFTDLLRILMIIHDPEKYFNSAWQQSFLSYDNRFIKILSLYYRDPSIIKEYVASTNSSSLL